MLALSRRVGERVTIGDDIVVTVQRSATPCVVARSDSFTSQG